MSIRLALALCAAAAGCSAHHESDDLVVGRDRAAAGAAASGPEQGDPGVAGMGSPSPAAGSRSLSATIQDREGVTLEVVTVGCAGTCFEVVAVARGGYPPYAYVWEDGSTNATRTLCPDASSEFSVVATDRGYSSDEFKREPETVKAEITAEVLACPDAGTPDAGTIQPPDASAPDAGSERKPLCIENGSFEEVANYGWRTCPADDPPIDSVLIPAVSDRLGPAAFDGRKYARLGPFPRQPIMISQRLCEPIRKGTSYYWTLAMTVGFASPLAYVDLYFASNLCGTDGMLATLQPGPDWTETCSSWPALWDAEYVTLMAWTEIEGATAYIDQFQAESERCPAP